MMHTNNPDRLADAITVLVHTAADMPCKHKACLLAALCGRREAIEATEQYEAARAFDDAIRLARRMVPQEDDTAAKLEAVDAMVRKLYPDGL